MRAFALAWLATAVLAPAGLAQQFTYDNTALPVQNVWTDGVELADMDNDGDIDVLFANGQGYGSGGALTQLFYKNDGAANFTNAFANLNVAAFNAKMVIAEDFDGDGDLDLMYAPEGAANPPTQLPRMLINQGGDQGGTLAVFADDSAARLPNRMMASFCVCAGDIDNDGDLDVVFTDGATFSGLARQVILYTNDGSGNFTDVTASQMPADTYNAQDVTLFDYDGDFDIDIVVSGKGQGGKRSRLYLNDSAGNFTTSTILNNLGTGATYEIDWGDLDGDNDFDGAVQSISGQNEGWTRNLGPTTVPTNTTFSGSNGNDDNEMALCDYDNDGDLDVFVGSLASTEKVYRNTGAVFTRVNGVIQAQSDSTLDFGIADLDGDNDYDLVTGQGESGGFLNKVYINSGPADTIAPTYLNVETPGSVSNPDTAFRVHVQDAVLDDGHDNITMTYAYTTVGGGGTAGGGTAEPMGGGMYRASVPTTTDTTSVSLTWTATDFAGNSSNSGPLVVTGRAFENGGFAQAGAGGSPAFVGVGTLRPGTSGSLNLSNAATSATAALFIGFASNPTPFKGGTLVPVPFIDPPILLTTSVGGAINLPWGSWPTGLPSGFEIFLQWVVVDATAPGGHAMSNVVEITAP